MKGGLGEGREGTQGGRTSGRSVSTCGSNCPNLTSKADLKTPTRRILERRRATCHRDDEDDDTDVDCDNDDDDGDDEEEDNDENDDDYGNIDGDGDGGNNGHVNDGAPANHSRGRALIPPTRQHDTRVLARSRN